MINRCVPAHELEWTVCAAVARKIATLGPRQRRAGCVSSPRRDLSARVGHIKGQLNGAWEQTMWQTFREEANLLSMPAGDSPANMPAGGPPA